MGEKRVTITNLRGLHARAAAKFATLAGEFDADVSVGRAGQSADQRVSGRSIMGLMMLAAAPGTEIDIACAGADGEAALAALTALVEAKFEED